PDGSQFIDIKKAAIVDFFGCNPPIGGSIGLRLDEFVQLVETVGVTRNPIENSKGLIDGCSHIGAGVIECRNAPLDDLLFSPSLNDSFRRNFCSSRQVIQRSQNASEFLKMNTIGRHLLSSLFKLIT